MAQPAGPELGQESRTRPLGTFQARCWRRGRGAGGGDGGCERPIWPPETMLAVLGAAALVLVARAPWVLPAAVGEPRGLGEGRAGRESSGRLRLRPPTGPRALTPMPSRREPAMRPAPAWGRWSGPEPRDDRRVGDQTMAKMHFPGLARFVPPSGRRRGSFLTGPRSEQANKTSKPGNHWASSIRRMATALKVIDNRDLVLVV